MVYLVDNDIFILYNFYVILDLHVTAFSLIRLEKKINKNEKLSVYRYSIVMDVLTVLNYLVIMEYNV